MASEFTDAKVVRSKMDRRDIAMLILAVFVVVEGAGVVYLIATATHSDLAVMRNKLEKQQEAAEKQQDAVKNLSDTTADIEDIRNKLDNQQDTLTGINDELQKEQISNKGVVYVRWGREDCQGNTTELVYSGYAGGSHYTHQGAAVEYVCLPPDPSWGPKQNIRSYGPGLIYGAEYEDELLFNVPDRSREVPCAVCRSSDQSTSIMIPARTTCYTGWDEAYHGYLASGHYGHKAASQYVCVDENPHTLTGGGSSDDNGILFYQVRTRCGSLKCPPYEEDKVLSCVVCMK